MKVSKEWADRFNAKYAVDAVNGCWIWTGAKYGKGYGEIKIPKTRRQIAAHRLSYMIHRGPIPRGRCVLHKCDNPPCVNPDHLFIGTKLDNALDMVSKMRHCYGENQGRHKLTEKDVLSIIGLIAIGVKQARIAKDFGISPMLVSRIRHGQRWAHLSGTKASSGAPSAQ